MFATVILSFIWHILGVFYKISLKNFYASSLMVFKIEVYSRHMKGRSVCGTVMKKS